MKNKKFTALLVLFVIFNIITRYCKYDLDIAVNDNKVFGILLFIVFIVWNIVILYSSVKSQNSSIYFIPLYWLITILAQFEKYVRHALYPMEVSFIEFTSKTIYRLILELSVFINSAGKALHLTKEIKITFFRETLVLPFDLFLRCMIFGAFFVCSVYFSVKRYLNMKQSDISSQD
ncbi:hypothetical protein [Diplocloster hominis]|uniref:hypothetical protein n=1 Tax=Diplocloster hominis TaxID=3079010 RepID=UPI0031B9B8AE